MTTTPTSGAADLPEALRLADWMQNAVATYPQMSEDEPGGYCQEIDQVMDQAAAELRRLHNESAEVHAGYRTEQYWQGWNAALAAGQATAAPAQPAAQQGVAYAALPTSNYAGRVYEEGFLIGTCPLYTADQLRAFADATYALRASSGQAPAPEESVTAPGGGVVAAGRFMDEAAERRSAQEGYENRIKRVSERNPHDEGMYSLGWWDRAWKAAAPTPAAQAADSVLEDAARLDWLLLRISGAEFRRLGVHYSGNAIRADVDAARKQGVSHDR